ncbi:hypothetical protein M3559_14200, partial [Staphylococcus equorum]
PNFTDANRFGITTRFDKRAKRFPNLLTVANGLNFHDRLHHVKANDKDVGQAEEAQEKRLIEHNVFYPVQLDFMEAPGQDAEAVLKTLIGQRVRAATDIQIRERHT